MRGESLPSPPDNKTANTNITTKEHRLSMYTTTVGGPMYGRYMVQGKTQASDRTLGTTQEYETTSFLDLTGLIHRTGGIISAALYRPPLLYRNRGVKHRHRRSEDR